MKNLLAVLVVICFNLIITPVKSQVNNGSSGIVSNYFHINYDQGSYKGYGHVSIVGFVFDNIDTTGNINWHSEIITQFEKETGETGQKMKYWPAGHGMDNGGFFVKLDIPANVANNSKGLWCTSIGLKRSRTGYDTIKNKYGGVELPEIQLNIKSSPMGAEAYLVPKKIWDEKFENGSWENDFSRLDKFRVNTGATNTEVKVTETSYVVIYKLADKYKRVYYYPKPFSVEKVQTVWIPF